MASRRRNAKTHPKPQGGDGQDGFPPEGQDRDAGADNGRIEVIDVFAKDAKVTVNAETGGDDQGVDRNSATEGDARNMSFEEGGDDGSGGDGGAVLDDGARSVRTARRSGGGRGNAGDDGDGGYSARVRSRIARERGLVNRERALREATQRQLAEEQTARRAQEERIARLERAQTAVEGNAGVKDLESKIEALRPQLAAAMEGGETAKVLELQEKISDLKAQVAVLKYDLQQRQRQAESQGGTRQQQGTATDNTAVIDDPEVAELAKTFQRMNRHWWNRTANKEARADAITIDKEILTDINSGELDFEPYSDEHFAELAARLHETYPDLEIQDLEGQPYQFDGDDMNDRGNGGNGGNGGRQQRGPGRSAAPVNRMGSNGRRAPSESELARQGKVTLDQKDFQTMRTFKMDPNNPEHKKYFAKEKMRSILTGARQSGGDR